LTVLHVPHGYWKEGGLNSSGGVMVLRRGVGGGGEAEGARGVEEDTAGEERERERKEGEGERDMYLDRIPSGNDAVAASTRGIICTDVNAYIYITVAIQTF